MKKHRDICSNPKLTQSNVDSLNEHIDELLGNITDPKYRKDKVVSSLWNSYKRLALFSYGLGELLVEFKAMLLKGFPYYQQVLSYRGGAEAFPIDIVTINIRDGGAKIEKNVNAEKKDWSVGNSHSTLRVCCLALCVGEDELARAFAEAIYDPPNADYIGHNKYARACGTTPDHQALAYAFRDYIVRDQNSAIEHLIGLMKEGKTRGIIRQGILLKALIEADKDKFIQYLEFVLDDHAREAKNRDNVNSPEYLFSEYGLALCRIAVWKKLLETNELPQHDYLPIEFLEEF